MFGWHSIFWNIGPTMVGLILFVSFYGFLWILSWVIIIAAIVGTVAMGLYMSYYGADTVGTYIRTTIEGWIS